ncbi:MAG: hypothetical protein ACR2PL_11845 [Dehalococcoidia bacterium]
MALPFQRVETINAPRGADLFTMLDTPLSDLGEGPGVRAGRRNKLIWGDNKLVMASLQKATPAPASSRLPARST